MIIQFVLFFDKRIRFYLTSNGLVALHLFTEVFWEELVFFLRKRGRGSGRKIISHFGDNMLKLFKAIFPLTTTKCLLGVWIDGARKTSKIIISREKLFHSQKIHFFRRPDHHCYSINERLGQLPYYYINFFSFHLVSIATLNCNFFFFFFIITI